MPTSQSGSRNSADSGPRLRCASSPGVVALVERLHSLPKSIRSALKRAGDSAAYLSDDRLQGLAELIQNADDLGATVATVAVDRNESPVRVVQQVSADRGFCGVIDFDDLCWAMARAVGGILIIGDAGRHGRPGGKPTWGPPAHAALQRLTATIR